MTRQQEMRRAMRDATENAPNKLACGIAFEQGVKWADAHPAEPKREVIDRASQWLGRELKNYITVQPYSTSANIDMDALLHDLKQAMKGDKK